MKYILIIALLGSISFTVGSCKKFLEEKAFSELNETIFPRNEEDLRVMANGMYNPMQVNEYYGRTYFIVNEVFTEELFAGNPSGDRWEMETHNITPFNGEVQNLWSRSYLIIARANTLIGKAPLTAANVPQSKINLYLGEARYLRAMAYFQLVRYFGDVPLIPRALTNVDSILAYKPARTPQVDVYKAIVEDLQFAEQNLPRESLIPANAKGRASSGAATALLAKVYLTRGYQPFAEPNDFQNAAIKCAAVISNTDYELLPNYADIFDIARENGREHIFSVQFDIPAATANANAIVSFLSPTQVYPRAFGSFQVERPFYNSFRPNDTIRRRFSIYDVGVGRTGIPYNFVASVNSRPFCGKYRDDNTLIANLDRTNNIFMRFADVLLMESEALNQTEPGGTARYNGINRVRQRVRLPVLTPGLTQSQFADSVLQERSWELCFEGQRRHDLVRTGKLVQVLTALGKLNIRPHHVLFPIPQRERDLNLNLTQNLGY
jgi:starch-binding outer membrane protein, SusD/RagB family